MEEANDDINEIEIKDGELLEAANNILSLLEYPQKIDSEEYLFSDDFYVSIIGNLLSDIQPEIKPGKTLNEKAEIMNKLIQTLSQAIEVDLPQIDGAAIVLNHDKVSAKNLLDLISELIKTIIDNNLEEKEEEEEEKNNFSEKKDKYENNEIANNDNYILLSDKNNTNKRQNLNLSESNDLNKNIEIEDDNDNENENENDNEEDSNNKNKNKKNEIIEEINYGEKDSVKSDKNKKKDLSDQKQYDNDIMNNLNVLTNNSTSSNKRNSKEKENEDKLKNSKGKDEIRKNNDEDNMEYSQELHNLSEESSRNNSNRSCFEQLDFQKMMNKLKDMENKVNNSYIRQTYSQNDISRYERNLEDAERNQTNEDEIENEIENNNDNENENENENENNNENENEHSKGNANSLPVDLNNGNMSNNIVNSDNIIYKEEDEKNISGETPIMNVSHITDVNKDENEKESENNLNKYINYNEKENENELNSSKKKK